MWHAHLRVSSRAGRPCHFFKLHQYQVRVISCVFGTKLSIIDTVRLCVKAEGARFPIQLNVMEEIFPSSVVSDFVMGPGFYKHWIPPVTDGAISPSALSFPVSNSIRRISKHATHLRFRACPFCSH